MATEETEIPKHYQPLFTKNVETLVQKSGSLLYPYVDHGSYQGNGAEVVKQFGPTAARIGDNTRHGDTPIMSTPRDQRWVFPTKIDWGDLFDRDDLMKMLIDPTSTLTMNAAAAVGRAIDTVIISALFGTAQTGVNGSTATVFPANGSQDVAATVGAVASTGMNVAKIIRGRRILRHNYAINRMDDLIFVGGAQQEEELFNDDKFINTRYRKSAVLEDADSNEFFRVHFLFLEEMPLDTVTDIRSCALYAKSGVHLGEWGGLMTKIGPDPSKQFNDRLYMKHVVGATRTQEKKVVRILCDESP